MNPDHSSIEYSAHVEAAKSRGSTHNEAMSRSVGGEFETLGLMQRWLLEDRGLFDGASIVDVGCGSGRTAFALADMRQLSYIGIDVVPALLEHAKTICGRPDWRFEVANGFRIPVSDASVDGVLFFSVITHLLHEESFLYLREAVRVLRPGSKIVVTFLQFEVRDQWGVFQHMVDEYGTVNRPLNMFFHPQWFYIWALHLGLQVEELAPGSEKYIRLRHEIVLQDGQVLSGFGSLGQSLCVLRKPIG
jgi:ubiquinone/menaquinone biosynthesis C-methylase UbiE